MTNLTQPLSTKQSPLADEDPRAVFARAVALGTAVIEAVRPEQLDGPTPCGAYDVKALLGHLVAVLRRVSALGRGDDPFAFPISTEGVADDGWPDAWLAAAHDVQAAWADDDTLARIVTLPWAELPGGAMLAMYTSEITTHTWDLATATDQHPAWDEHVVGIALAAARQGLPAGNRVEASRKIADKLPPELRDAGPPFAEAVTVPASAPLIDQLVAWNGRQP